MNYTVKARMKMVYWHYFGVPCYACKGRMTADERVYRENDLVYEHRVCECGAREGQLFPMKKKWRAQ